MYDKLIKEHQLDLNKYRTAWAFMVGNPWENSSDARIQINPTMFEEADQLAKLVLDGTKTATASALSGYDEGEHIPEVDGKFDILLDGHGKPICAITTTKVYLVKFDQVSSEHAFKEGEGDRSLLYWREVHENFFKEFGLFAHDMDIVCEEFEVIAKF